MNIHLPSHLQLNTFNSLYGQLHRLARSEPLHLHMKDLTFAEPAGLLPVGLCFEESCCRRWRTDNRVISV